MNYSNLLRIAVRALIRNKMRAFLTMLGIIIGVGSVIAMLSLGEGSKQNITGQMSSMGTNMMVISPNYQQKKGGVNVGAANAVALKYSDVIALRNEAKTIAAVSPEVRLNAKIIFGNQNAEAPVIGVSEEYFSIRKIEIGNGRVFNQGEVRDMSKVCILGQTVVDNLFGVGVDPVGLTIRIRNLPFQVIGVLKDKGDMGGQDQDDQILAPYTTVQRRMVAIDYINSISISAISEDKSTAAIAEVEEILRRQHKINNEDEESDFRIFSQSELIETVSSITGILTVLLGAIAGISLLVGGIGIMNIMMVSVTERTREIGLRMSIGGRGKDILAQFLVESMLLSILGGVIGIIFGYLMGTLAGSLMNVEAIVKPQSVVLAFVVCFAIGVFFGWYPARKAANLNPIDALRYE